MRRDTSGCKPTFDLIEYAMDIDLPEFVVRHPVIQALNQGANDLVTVRRRPSEHLPANAVLTDRASSGAT